MDGVVDSIGLWIFHQLHIEGVSLLTTFIIISMICQLITRIIPEDATGWKCHLRKVCAVIGLYVANRVSAGVSVTDVAREVIKNRDPDAPATIKEKVDERIQEATSDQHEDVLELTEADIAPPPPFPGLLRPKDPKTGAFLPFNPEGEE